MQLFECIQSSTNQALYIIVSNTELIAADGRVVKLEKPWFEMPQYDAAPQLVPVNQLHPEQVQSFIARIALLDAEDLQLRSNPVPVFWTGRKYTTDEVHGPLNGGPVSSIFVRNRGRVVACKFAPKQNPNHDNFEFWIPSDSLHWLQNWQASGQALPVFIMESSPRQWRCAGWCVVEQTIWEGPAVDRARRKAEKTAGNRSSTPSIGCIIKIKRIPEREMSPALKHIS